MKSNGDLGARWLKKAESDFDNVQFCLDRVGALDAACFHCQQAAEKSLKAWLISRDIDPPKTHELKELIALCTPLESQFNQLLVDADALTPYAVKERYDADFWPTLDQARIALEQARRIYDFVKAHWDK